MNNTNSNHQQPTVQRDRLQSGLSVRTDVRAGDWNCNSCQGQVSGSTLFRPTCGYCQPS